METASDLDQFELLERKIDNLIELIASLRREKESLAEKSKIQEEKLSDLTRQIQTLRSGRDQAKQKIISLLEKIEEVSV